MPIWAGGAAIVGGGIGALGSYFGGKAQAKGYAQAQQMFAPYDKAGKDALTTLSSLYGPNGMTPEGISAFRNAPGYQFSRGEGLRGVDFGDSARGMLLSSNNLRNRQEFGTGLADKTFMGSYVQPLLQLAGIGAQGAQGAANARIGQGTAQGGMYVGMGNAINQGLAGAGNAIGQYNNNQTLMSLYNGGMNRGGYQPMYGGGPSYSPGTAANGGWGTTVWPS